MSRRRRAFASALLLSAILAVAAGLRFWGLDFGLPHPLARPDEREILLPTWGFSRGDLNPKYHVYPGLYLYLVWLWGEAGLAARRLFLATPPYAAVLMRDLQGQPGGADGDLLLIGRALSAFAGTLTVLVLYLVARRREGRATALAAAALLATCFLHVRDSHALKAEALFTLAVVPAIAACARLAEAPAARRAAAAGAWIGIATGMKQPGSLLLIPLWAAGVLGAKARGLRRWLPGALVLLGGVVALVVFLATGPYLVLDWGFAWRKMCPAIGTVLGPGNGSLWQQLCPGIAAVPAPAVDPSRERAFLYHVTVSFRHGTGLLFTLLVAPALALGLVARDPLAFLAALFSLVWLVVIGVSPVHHVRYLTPILPLLALLVAYLLARVTRPAGRAAAPLLALLTVAIAAEPLAASVAHDRILARSDTRVLATRWLASHARPGDTVAILGTQIWPYGVPLLPPGVKPRPMREGEPDLGPARFLLTHEHQLPFSHVRPADLERLAPRLALEVELSPYSGARPGGWFEAADAYYAPFLDFAGVERPGPLIRIYSVRDAP